MRNLPIRMVHIILIICFLVLGAILLSAFSGIVKLMGFALLGVSALYILYIFFFGIESQSKENNFRSQTRDQIWKYQHKNKKPV